MFSKTEKLILSVIGVTRCDIRPICLAIDLLPDMIFMNFIPVSKIFVIRDVYTPVGVILGKSVDTVSRSIGRLANRIWDTAKDRGMLQVLIGHSNLTTPSVAEILIYLAYFIHYDKPLFSALDDIYDLNTIA